VDTTDLVDGQPVHSTVTEQFVLIPEGGTWHIDQVSRL
jgi:hypothetical protein